MTDQEIFDKVVIHLITQGGQSIDEKRGLCLYRTEQIYKTLSCAIGCLIPDDLYSPAMESLEVSTIVAHFPIIGELLMADAADEPDRMFFLSQLQQLHDLEENWNGGRIDFEAVRLTAYKFKLSDQILTEY